jgi:hypothetical protein
VSVPWRVVQVIPLPGYRLRVHFADGTEGEVQASGLILGSNPGVFERLRDEAQFNAVYVDHGAVTWPGELDLAPDAMYDEIRAHGLWNLSDFDEDSD